jgi:hypothetical protein
MILFFLVKNIKSLKKQKRLKWHTTQQAKPTNQHSQELLQATSPAALQLLATVLAAVYPTPAAGEVLDTEIQIVEATVLSAQTAEANTSLIRLASKVKIFLKQQA